MPQFKDLYLSKDPISSTYLNRVINGQNVTSDGRTHNTPTLEIKNQMVTAVKRTFLELEKTGKVPKNLVPSKVFGFNDNHENNYNEVARFIVEYVIEFLNDQYGSYKNNKFENMFDAIFSQPVNTDLGKRYLRIDPYAIFNRTHDKVCALFRQANFQLPFTALQREKFKQIYRDAYYDLIEGTIAMRNNQPVVKNGKHIIESPSELQVALKMIKNNSKFYSSDFGKVNTLSK